MAIRWTQEVDGGPRRVNHAAVSVRDRFIFSFGGYCTGEEYNQIVNIDVHVFDTGKFGKVIVDLYKLCAKCANGARRAVEFLNVGATRACQISYRKCIVFALMRASYILTLKSICLAGQI